MLSQALRNQLVAFFILMLLLLLVLFAIQMQSFCDPLALFMQRNLPLVLLQGSSVKVTADFLDFHTMLHSTPHLHIIPQFGHCVALHSKLHLKIVHARVELLAFLA